jgi:hypothetical protein
MHPQLTLIIAQQHIADLHRAADHNRLVQSCSNNGPPPPVAPFDARRSSWRTIASIAVTVPSRVALRRPTATSLPARVSRRPGSQEADAAVEAGAPRPPEI